MVECVEIGELWLSVCLPTVIAGDRRAEGAVAGRDVFPGGPGPAGQRVGRLAGGDPGGTGHRRRRRLARHRRQEEEQETQIRRQRLGFILHRDIDFFFCTDDDVHWWYSAQSLLRAIV